MDRSLDVHQRLLIATCEGRFDSTAKDVVDQLLSAESLDSIKLVQEAIHHRVSGTVYRNLEEWGWAWRLSGATGRNLHAISLGIRMRNTLMRQECAKVCAALEHHGVSCAVIKGPAIEELAYGGLEERHYGDIDILVSHDDLHLVRSVLNGLGYVQGRYRGRGQVLPAARDELLRSVLHTHETFPFVKTFGGDLPELTLDINFLFSWRGHPRQPIGLQIEPKAILPYSRLSTSAKKAIPVLPPEVSLLGICGHIMTEASLFAFGNSSWAKRKSDHILSRNTDVLYLLNSQKIDWNIVQALADTPEAEEAYRYGLQATSKVYRSLPVPGSWLDRPSAMLSHFVLPSGDLARWSADYLQRLMHPDQRMRDALSQIRVANV